MQTDICKAIDWGAPNARWSINPDGTFADWYHPDHPEPPTEDQLRQWLAEALRPDPDWGGLVSEFLLPGCATFVGLFSVMNQCGAFGIEHWSNLKSLITIADLRNIEALAMGIQYFKALAQQANATISPELTAEWNRLIVRYHFPESCKL